MSYTEEIIKARMIDGPHGELAVITRDGRGPGLFWLGGYASDMRGTKAEALDDYAADCDLAYTRFDYSGHGESAGEFEDGTISSWTADAAHVLANETQGPQILVGSSMGGWVAGLLLREMPEKIAGMVLINPAPDFATELTPKQWPEELWAKLQRDGRIEIPSEFDDSVMVYTKAMFDDGAKASVLDQPLKAHCPVRMLSGMKDDVVPYTHVLRYAEHIEGSDVSVALVPEGDHRLSRDEDIMQLMSTIEELVG
ncbi:alpha/beta hydrolase [Parvularcula marina]|uniref:alpha/beta hydrolase n=1 Tax=Parvularcula marina TaxID=2292771 RepID=UPI00351632A1